MVALAFKSLYPTREYTAYIAPKLEDGETSVCGETTFPEDGSRPIVAVSGKIPIAAGVEVLAHERAHVVTPEDQAHGEAWCAAFDLILQEYNRIGQELFGKDQENEA